MKRLISELGYLGFEVSDMARWKLFATDVLGLAFCDGPRPDVKWLRMDEYTYRFILCEGSADDCILAGWKVQDVTALEEFSARLNANGIAWDWGTESEVAERAVDHLLQFADPAGNRHEVYCGGTINPAPFSSAMVPNGFVTHQEGLGHIVYSSGAYAATQAFACNVLGLSPSDQIIIQPAPGINFEVSFFHTNTRHHSFALAPQRPGPGPHKQIHHFMIEVKNIEDVGLARDRCLAMGQMVNMDIGQHPNDRMISFYGQTPSGFFVEFGWGGVKVDPHDWKPMTYDRLSTWGHRPHADIKSVSTTARREVDDRPERVAGVWKVTIDTPLGKNNVNFEFAVDGSTLSGAITGPNENNVIRNGKVQANRLTWQASVTSPMPMDLDFSAEVTGDSITGSAKSPFGSAPFAGTR